MLKNKLFNTIMLLFFLVSTTIFAQIDSTKQNNDAVIFNYPDSVNENSSYKINNVFYKIKGITMEMALKNTVPIDTKTVYNSKLDFEKYVKDVNKRLQNQRVLESVIVEPYFNAEESGIIPVDLYIQTVDTLNVIVFPYPKYDSNSGFDFKLKLKDYNFIGSMKTLNADLSYAFNTGNQEQKIGLSTNFGIPFKAGISYANWNVEAGIDYIFGKLPSLYFSTGLGFSIPVNFMSFDFSFSQGINYNPDAYPVDKVFFTENASLSMPINLGKIPEWGSIFFGPTANINWKWDPDIRLPETDGISHPNLKGPTGSLGYFLSGGDVDWVGNFRKGMNISFNNSWNYNFFYKSITPTVEINSAYFCASKYVGFNSNLNYFSNFNGTSEAGGRLRGVPNRGYSVANAFTANLDLPIKLFETDWVKLGLPSWTRYVDFELQLAIFLDMSLGSFNNRGYLIEDGLYSAGMEVLVFPKKMRSLVGRISFGVDAARTVLPSRIVNKAWRPALSRFELFIGIGLFY